MKKINLSISAVFLVFGGICQPLKSNVVNAVIPEGSVAMTKDEVVVFIKENFKGHEIPLDDKYLNVENYCRLDGLIISFWDFEINPEFKRSLEDISSEIGGILKRNNDTVNFNRIVTINNIKFLEYEYVNGNEADLWFQSDLNKNYQNICGVIQLKKGDEAKAQKFLDDFLSTVHFKELIALWK